MANPTSSVFLQANSGYAWSDGDVYQIAQTDQVEGAATGASFSGIGVENQPHQLLLNKIQYTHNKQITDEANIAAIQQFDAEFTSSVGSTGWRKTPSNDVNLGQIQIIEQWGVISLLGLPNTRLQNGIFAFQYPLIFPNAIWVLHSYWMSNDALYNQTDRQQTFALGGAGALILQTKTPLNRSGGVILTDQMVGVDEQFAGDLFIKVAQTATDNLGLTGIGWRALGY